MTRRDREAISRELSNILSPGDLLGSGNRLMSALDRVFARSPF